jgi:hypothetical protein
MASDHQPLRKAFADFLRRLAAGTAGPIEWERFIVTHYQDETLEKVRREVAKLAIESPGARWSDSEIEKFQYWARLLREAS